MSSLGLEFRARFSQSGQAAVATVMTFALVTAAQMALADGDPQRAATALGAAHGLRRRAGLTASPLARRREGRIITHTAEGSNPVTYEAAFAAGAGINFGAPLALVRNDRPSRPSAGCSASGVDRASPIDGSLASGWPSTRR